MLTDVERVLATHEEEPHVLDQERLPVRIYRAETTKTLRVYVPKECLILLKKMKFVEKLQQKNKNLKIEPDPEGEGIYFEGPDRHINEATEMLQKQMSDMVKINKGEGNDDFDISGNNEGLIRTRRKLDALIKDTTSETFDVRQPGLRKFFDSGKGDRLVKSVEKDHSCVIQVQKKFGQRWDDWGSLDSASSGSDDSDVDDDDDEDVIARSGSDVFSLMMTRGHHKISWRPGNIETEKVSVEGNCLSLFFTEAAKFLVLIGRQQAINR